MSDNKMPPVTLLALQKCLIVWTSLRSEAHSLNSDRFCIIGADLRDLSNLDAKLKKFNLNPEYVIIKFSSPYHH